MDSGSSADVAGKGTLSQSPWNELHGEIPREKQSYLNNRTFPFCQEREKMKKYRT